MKSGARRKDFRWLRAGRYDDERIPISGLFNDVAETRAFVAG